MKCRHENTTDNYWWVQLYGQFDRHENGLAQNRMHWRTCDVCGHWLPLGHSDETPVAVEIRAAELAEPGALLRNGHEGNGRCDVGDDWYSDHDEYPDDWHAGYLARVIAEHGEDQ